MAQIKIVGFLAAIVALLMTIGYACHQSYQAGVNSQKAKQAEEFQTRYNESLEDFKNQLEEAQHESTYWRQVAVTLQSSPAVPATKTITKIVHDSPACSVIPGLASLYERSRSRFKPAGTSTAGSNTGD